MDYPIQPSWCRGMALCQYFSLLETQETSGYPENHRWGTDVQHLSTIHLQPRKLVAQGNPPKKILHAPTSPPHPHTHIPSTHTHTKTHTHIKPSKSFKSKPDKPVCPNHNSQKGCNMAEHNYRHVCIIPRCGQ